MELFRRIILVIVGMMILIALLITSVLSVAFNFSFYEREYTKLSTAASLNMEEDELMRVTDEMVDYLKGKRPDLHIEATVGGETVAFFNEREILHMVDVLKLADDARWVRTFFIIVGVAIFCIFLFGKSERRFRQASGCFLMSEAIMLGLGIALGIFILSGQFDVFWIKFHQIVFTNDLWLLDPRTDRLINLVPETFFYDLCMRALITFITGMVVLSGLATWGYKANQAKEGK
jgi:integral membrane protein (TIGR01906 family)